MPSTRAAGTPSLSRDRGHSNGRTLGFTKLSLDTGQPRLVDLVYDPCMAPAQALHPLLSTPGLKRPFRTFQPPDENARLALFLREEREFAAREEAERQEVAQIKAALDRRSASFSK